MLGGLWVGKVLLMGRCSLLVGLKCSSQSLNQLALALENVTAVTESGESDVIDKEEAFGWPVVGHVINVGDK